MEENEDAWRLWQSSMTQWRMGISGPVGLDYAAVERIAAWTGVTLDTITFRKIQALEAEFLGDLYGPRKQESKKKCAHPDACAMCGKTCGQRVAESRR